MYYFILLAFCNGIVIALARVVNARLGESKGPMSSSFWNHLVGFLLLLVTVPFVPGFSFDRPAGRAPAAAYFGGVIGVSFVALHSFVLPKLGAMRTILLVIGGQMITASALDLLAGAVGSYLMQALGVSLIVLGITVSGKATPAAEDSEGRAAEGEGG